MLVSNAHTTAQAPEDVEFEAQKVAGTVDVEVKTELPDGSILANSFKVTVKEPSVTIANSGFTLVAQGTDVLGAATDDAAKFSLANTAAFKAYGAAKTSLTVGTSADLYAFAETNGNPDIKAIDWEDTDNSGKKEVTSVKSSNAIVADVEYNAGAITVTGNSVGTSTITVTFKDNTKKTFNISVTDVKKFKGFTVDKTSVGLSDEARTTGTEGVDQATVNVWTTDQNGKPFDADIPGTGFITVTSSTDGITVGDTSELDQAAGRADRLVLDSKGEGTLTITAKESKIVKNAKVTLSYFAKATDTKPTSTQVITVNVVDVDPSVSATSVDVAISTDKIDANAVNVTSDTAPVFDEIEFDKFDAFLLDAKGNRIGTTAVSAVELLSKNDANVIANGTVIEFADSEAQTYLRAADTVNVKMTATDNAKEISKNVKVSYLNSAVLPNSAKVATGAVSLKVDPDTYTIEELLFGKVDTDQLVLDDTDSVNIAIKKNAKNAGYKYNKPLVTITGTNGKDLPIGTSLYGSTVTELEASTALWNNEFINDVLLKNGFAVDGFEYDLAISNVVSTDKATNTADETNGVTVTSGNSVTFTLVIKGIYTEGAKAKAVANAAAHASLLAGTPVTLTPAEEKEAEATQNLLSAPVQVNISVAGK